MNPNDPTINPSNIINTEFTSKNVIPVVVKSKSGIPGSYGNSAKDNWLQFQLDNETGNYLTLETRDNKSIISLWSKSGKLLSSVDLMKELPSLLGVRDKYLYVDLAGKITWKSGRDDSKPFINVLYNTTANWNKQTKLIAQLGTLYVYTDKDLIQNPDGSFSYVPGLKIGDGSAYLIDKPFLTDAIEAKLIAHIEDTLVHIQPGERERWNNKLNVIDPVVTTDLLQFTRD